MRAALIGFCCCVLAGCAVNPTVRYAEAANPGAVSAAAPHLIDNFYLQRNDVVIAIKAIGDPKTAAPEPELVVTDTRTEDQRHRLMLLRADKAWARTTIALTKVENTDLIDTAGIEVEDRRVQLLEAAGGVVKTLIAIGGSASGSGQREQLGCADFPVAPCALKQPAELGIAAAGGSLHGVNGLAVTWGPVPASAVRAADFFARLPSRPTNGLYYAACRSLRVDLDGRDPSGQAALHFTWRGRIADPDWIEFVAFPRKGNVRMHSQCGVSITSDKDPTQPVDALVSAAVAQALAIKDAVGKH